MSERARYSNKQQFDRQKNSGNGAAKCRRHSRRRTGGEERFSLDCTVAMICPTNDPSAPPVAMIGPSAPNGPAGSDGNRGRQRLEKRDAAAEYGSG